MTSELYRKLVLTKSAICLMRAVKLDALEGILGKTSLKHFFFMTSVLCLKMRYLSNIMGMFHVILSPKTSLSSKKRLFTDCESDHISMA